MQRKRKWSVEERKTFVRNNKLCLDCLTTGHFVRACPKSSFCKVDGCTGKHSTFLHPEDKLDKNQEPKVTAGCANNGYVKITPKTTHPKASSVTGLAIVPVRVKAAGRSELVETYAFLDSGSNTSFCTEELLKRLNDPGQKQRCLEKVTLSNVQLSNWKSPTWTIKIESTYQMYIQRRIYQSAPNVLAS